MRIVFLDIDGVLNHESRIRPGVLVPELVKNLNILTGPTTGFVLTSAWRYLMELKEIQALLAKNGFKGKIVGVTDHSGTNRVQQIERWITEHKPENYVVLDDHPLRMSNFVHVSGGLSVAAARAALNILDSH